MFKELYGLIPDKVEYNREDIWDFEEFQQKIISKLISLRTDHRIKIKNKAMHALPKNNSNIKNVIINSINFDESGIKIGFDFTYKSSDIGDFKIIHLSWDEI